MTPSGLLPWDSHQTMTSILVWDTGRPNGDQRHPLVPVGPVVRSTAATCLVAAVACPHYGPNTTTSLSMGEGYIYSACESNQMALSSALNVRSVAPTPPLPFSPIPISPPLSHPPNQLTWKPSSETSMLIDVTGLREPVSVTRLKKKRGPQIRQRNRRTSTVP